jgi:hypothetical protein
MGAGHWRPGGLLGSPFKVKWRFSVLAGDVEESKLCLFSVIMPAKCVSSVSPRFHYRRLAFCFLPLAAILEFLLDFLNGNGLKSILSQCGDYRQSPNGCKIERQVGRDKLRLEAWDASHSWDRRMS